MELGALVTFGLLLVRVGALVATAPVFGGVWAPAQFKVGLTVLLTILLMPFVPMPAVLTASGLLLLAAREFLVGLALAMAIRLVVAAAELGGYLIGFQLGFAYAGIVDPQSGVRNNMLAVLYGSLAVLTLFLMNAHHTLIRLLATSYEAVPVGTGAGFEAGEGLVRVVGRMGALVFMAGLQLAAPVILVLALVEVVLGIVTRAAPTLNLMTIGQPLRLLVGLFALAAALPVVPGLVSRLIAGALELAAQAGAALR